MKKQTKYLYVSHRRDHFQLSWTQLARNSTLPHKSSLQKYHPFIDEVGILRVGGRLEHSHLAYSRRHPILLHASSSYGALLIRKVHAEPVCHLHQTQSKDSRTVDGPIASSKGQSFSTFLPYWCGLRWPCFTKARQPAQTNISQSIHRSICLHGYQGYTFGISGRPNLKCISSLSRPICRKKKCPCPHMIYSDHGTNFVGAKNQLQQLKEFFEKKEVTDRISHYSTQEGIVWHMTPERCPHFGGLWESVVCITKKHIIRSIGEQKLTHPQYTTLLCKVEASINSRPLIPAAQADADGIEPLTPAHFLTGRPMKTVPDRYDGPRPPSLPKYWTLVQTMHRSFWTRFQNEYLQSLNRMNKWSKTHANIQVGDLVAIKDEGLDKKLTMGRVEAVYPGNDKLVRVASVKTATGTYKRPIVKLVRLLRVEDT